MSLMQIDSTSLLSFVCFLIYQYSEEFNEPWVFLYMHGLAIGNQFEGAYEFNQSFRLILALDSSLVGGTDTNL